MYSDGQGYLIDQQFIAFLVGLTAIGLPFVMFFSANIGVCFFDSISHFYYAPFFGSVFVASLAFIGTFLLAYRGENKSESQLASIAGICAFGVAMLPTSGPGCERLPFPARIFAKLSEKTVEGESVLYPAQDPDRFFELFKFVGILHYASAVLLLSFLAYYSFVVFTRVIPSVNANEDGTPTAVKKIRNKIYITSGVLIVVSILVLGASALISRISGESWNWWNDFNLTFWFEALALVSFGVSWMVKSRFYGKLLLDERDKRAA